MIQKRAQAARKLKAPIQDALLFARDIEKRARDLNKHARDLNKRAHNLTMQLERMFEEVSQVP